MFSEFPRALRQCFKTIWNDTYPGFQQEGECGVSSELNIGSSNNHADSSMADDSLRELAMNLQKSSIKGSFNRALTCRRLHF